MLKTSQMPNKYFQVVVVTVQYRLGSFGFLFLDDQRAPGNVGLLDQKMATIWVRNNIVAFGGDPDKVTLAGQDAGGVLALILLSTSETKLASRIILQSAGIQHPWSYIEPREAFRRTLTLASLLDCPTSGTSREEVIKCLVQKNAEDIVDKEIGVVASPGLNYQPFVPTADGVTIKLEPSKLMPRIAKEMKDIQILIGTNSDEGSKALMYFLPKSFPNRDLSLVEASISQEFFDEAIEKMFSNFPARVSKLP
jgi:carboxylesterase type B